jgi:hydroxyacyl-ACP dehydratase HTD2-like protein with hotdog domain
MGATSSRISGGGGNIDIETIRADMLARPPQIHPDIMSPTNSRLLLNTLSDFIPAGEWHQQLLNSNPKKTGGTESISSDAPPVLLPPGHHLVYFPLARPKSQLCPDGTDPYHSPHNTPFTRRMWAGGSISGFQGSRLLLDCRKALCHERIMDVSIRGSPGSEKIFVEVLREYVTEDEFNALYDSEAETLRPRAEDSGFEEGSRLTERRTLVFMRELSDYERKRNLALSQRVVKCKSLFPSIS